jgi:transposase
MRRYAGLDVHSKSCVYVIQDELGNVVGRGSVSTTPEGLRQIVDLHELPVGTPAGLESGTNSFFVVDILGDLGLAPVVIDAREVRAKTSRPLQKSDRRDAFEICDGLRRGIYSCIVWVPPADIRLAREIVARRRHFVRVKTSQVNAVKRLLRGNGQTPLSRSLSTPAGWEKLIRRVTVDVGLQDFIRSHFGYGLRLKSRFDNSKPDWRLSQVRGDRRWTG